MNDTLEIPAPTVITHETRQLLGSIFSGSPKGNAQAWNLDELAVKVDWDRKRTLWMIYGDCDAAVVEAVFKRISRCSKVAMVPTDIHLASSLNAKQRNRLDQWLGAKRLSIIAGGNVEQRAAEVLKLIDIDHLDSWKPVLPPLLLEERSEEVRALFRELSAGINTKTLHKSTRLQMSSLFLRNALINAPLAWVDKPLDAYKDCLKNRPVLLVSAGPSLNKQLDLLAANQDLFTVLAVDTVWPILNAKGIQPDFLVALDPITPASWPINGIDGHTQFLVDMGCSPDIVWSHNRNHLFTTCNQMIFDGVAEMGAMADPLETGGSVATSAFCLARWLGGNPVILIGQDLALTGGKDHADGYMYAYDESHLKARTMAGYDVEGYYGDTVRTERQLLFYKTWFESQIKALPPESMVINATEGGARIHGSLQLPFAQVCEQIRSTSLRKPLLPKRPEVEVNVPHMLKLEEALHGMKDKVLALQDLAREGLEACDRPLKKASGKQMKRIDEINAEIRQFDRRAKMMVEVFGMTELEKVRYATHIRQDMQSISDSVGKYREVYQKFLDASEKSIELIDRIACLYEKVRLTQRFDIAYMKEALGPVN